MMTRRADRLAGAIYFFAMIVWAPFWVVLRFWSVLTEPLKNYNNTYSMQQLLLMALCEYTNNEGMLCQSRSKAYGVIPTYISPRANKS